jgi:hypothetical protein
MIELEQLTGCLLAKKKKKRGLAALNFSICKISRLVTVDEQNDDLDTNTNKGRKMMAGSFWFHSPRFSFSSTCYDSLGDDCVWFTSSIVRLYT